jgi:hypothetical protein
VETTTEGRARARCEPRGASCESRALERVNALSRACGVRRRVRARTGVPPRRVASRASRGLSTWPLSRVLRSQNPYKKQFTGPLKGDTIKF